MAYENIPSDVIYALLLFTWHSRHWSSFILTPKCMVLFLAAGCHDYIRYCFTVVLDLGCTVYERGHPIATQVFTWKCVLLRNIFYLRAWTLIIHSSWFLKYFRKLELKFRQQKCKWQINFDYSSVQNVIVRKYISQLRYQCISNPEMVILNVKLLEVFPQEFGNLFQCKSKHE